MNTYIYTGGSSLLTMKDNDIKNFDTISNHYLNIDLAWVIEEDGTFVANEKEYDVKAGDVILVLYAGYREKEVPVKDRRKVKDFVIIRNEDFYNKKGFENSIKPLIIKAFFFCRGSGIRTHDPLLPKQVR